MKRKPKALVLFSGGLDSRLATMMMREQLGQKNVELVFFALPFGGGCCNDRFCSIKFSQLYGMKLHVIDCTKGAMFRKYMAVIKKPRFSRGVAFNPCIDCHLFMLKEAGKLASRLKADFLVTGEVVGERPLSQNRHAMGIIEKEAGLVGKVLRPLSAKLMEETVAEKKGWVEREKLLAINGKKRSEQMALAKSYGIEFPMPAGGCVLTDVEYSRRLVNIMKYSPDPGIEELALVRLGRHFVSGKSTVIVGRNREENERLL